MRSACLAVFAVGAFAAPAATQTASAPLHQVEIVDEQGFARPLVALRFLAPVGWKVTGGVRWNPGYSCVSDMVTVDVLVTSPDGRTALQIFPVYAAEWVDDPLMRQYMVQASAYGGGGCPLRPPFSAAEFIADVLVPGFRSGARVQDVEQDVEAARRLEERIRRQWTGYAAGAGLNIDSDAARARLSYSRDGVRYEERIVASTFATTTRSLSASAAWYGSMDYTSSHFSYAERVFGFRAPAGEFPAWERTFERILSSFEVDPAWTTAVEQVMWNISRIQAAGAAERSEIWRRTNAEIQEIQQQTWRDSQAANDRNHERFLQYIRGTVTYVESSTGRTQEFEDSGTRYIWTDGGTGIIPTDDPYYDPNLEAGTGYWTRYQRQP